MARQLRIQYPGALYHIINRGNYRGDVFETAGAAHAFEVALAEACERHSWQLHAYAILRNHFHLALETPHPNLVEGMHWLQSTYATRFNRYRAEHGHLFQGRYQSLLIGDEASLVRVIDYIHLNPVRAGIIPPSQVGRFRWCSLRYFLSGQTPGWLSSARLQAYLEFDGSHDGWNRYVEHLKYLSASPLEQERLGFDQLCRGWAIGTIGWRKAIALEYARFASTPDLPQVQIREFRESRWRASLDEILHQCRRTNDDISRAPTGARWKIEIAHRLRREVGASYGWIAHSVNTLKPASLRVAVCRYGNI